MRATEQTTSFSLQAGVTQSVAFIALHNYLFCDKTALAALRDDRPKNLDNCGLRHRANQDSSKMVVEEQQLTGFTCEICYDDVEGLDTYALPCGHAFCRPCWITYLRSAFENGLVAASTTVCPRHDCGERLASEDVESIDAELSPRWKKALLSSYITKHELYRPCPGADCHVVAYMPHVSQRTITCEQCTTSCCFQCGHRPHEPAQCGDFDAWNTIFATSSYWYGTRFLRSRSLVQPQPTRSLTPHTASFPSMYTG